MKTTEGLREALVSECVTGVKEAWTELFKLCQPLLLRQIASWLWPRNCGELTEEIAGRVWLKLIEKQFERLARFDASRGVKLTTYMVALARNEFLMVLREEKRRLRRESHRAQTTATWVSEDMVEVEVEEFLATLEATERAFVSKELLGRMPDFSPIPPDEAHFALSRKSLNKLHQFLNVMNAPKNGPSCRRKRKSTTKPEK